MKRLEGEGGVMGMEMGERVILLIKYILCLRVILSYHLRPDCMVSV